MSSLPITDNSWMFGYNLEGKVINNTTVWLNFQHESEREDRLRWLFVSAGSEPTK